MTYSHEDIKALEVAPNEKGWYYITMYQYKKENSSDPDYLREWLFFDGQKWDYAGTYDGTCYVCFIHERSCKMTFDIQKYAPEGYEIIDYRWPNEGELWLDELGRVRNHCIARSVLIVRKKWTPKKGELIAVKSNAGHIWRFMVFEEFYDKKAVASPSHEYPGAVWEEYRQITPEEWAMLQGKGDASA